MDFGIANVVAITVLVYIIGLGIKATKLDNKWIPVICGLSGVILGMESTQAIMSHAGRSLLLNGSITTPDEIIQNYDAVTAEQIKDLARRIFDFNAISLSAVGQVRSKTEYKKLLKA